MRWIVNSKDQPKGDNRHWEKILRSSILASELRENKPQAFALEFLEYLKKTRNLKHKWLFLNLGFQSAEDPRCRSWKQWRRASPDSEFTPVRSFLSLHLELESSLGDSGSWGRAALSCSSPRAAFPRALGRDNSSLVSSCATGCP